MMTPDVVLLPVIAVVLLGFRQGVKPEKTYSNDFPYNIDGGDGGCNDAEDEFFGEKEKLQQ